MGCAASSRDVEVVRVPVADGGDGTLDAFVSAGFERHPVTVSGPCGEPVSTAYARRGDVAVVELADASGLSRLGSRARAPDASTRGTGEAIRAAVAAGCSEVVVGLGGSASTDGGAGLVTALGARILDADGRPVPPGGAGLLEASRLDLAALLDGVTRHPGLRRRQPAARARREPRRSTDRRRAPRPDDVAVLEEALAHWADLVADATGRDLRDGARAPAPPGAPASARWRCSGRRCARGSTTVLELVGFADALPGADLVVTGEGSVDEQSLRGKAPFGVLAGAAAAGLPTVVVCGRCTLAPDEIAAAGIARLCALADVEPDPARSMSRAAPLLEEVGADVAAWLIAAR